MVHSRLPPWRRDNPFPVTESTASSHNMRPHKQQDILAGHVLMCAQLPASNLHLVTVVASDGSTVVVLKVGGQTASNTGSTQ